MSQEFQAPRGTLDWYGARAALRRSVLDAAREVFELAGYSQVVTPTFEDTGVFARTSGEGSDVVRKEMYSFTDRSGRPLTLRPEGTAGVMRAYLEHMTRLPQPVKVWYEVPMFRYAAVQKGRYREHYQFGAEVIGSDDAAVDAELIGLQRRWYEQVGVNGLRLLVNSIGDGKCRPAYLELLVGFLDEHANELCDECRERRDVNPLRTFDCKQKGCRAVMASAPKITDNLCDECAAHFADVRAHLDARGVEYAVDPGLVRGLDYYTRTAFEFVSGSLSQAQATVCGGGRYDGLAEVLGGPPTPGVGFAIGLDRVLLALREEGATLPGELGVACFVVSIGPDASQVGTRLVQDLRDAGIPAAAAFEDRPLKAQLKMADRAGARFAAIIGDQEVADNSVTIRDLRDGQQREVTRGEVGAWISQRI
jgi:histidyl-tRNA synthetase